jgi:hypothetical protein
MGVLSGEQATDFYDWLGARQNWQAFYENPAIEDVLAHGRRESA